MSDLEKQLSMPASQAARRLLGCELERIIGNETIKVRIVEVEAYDETDAASHSYKGRTPRTDVMFGPAGRLYVYFTYGMHYCCNVTVGKDGEGAAVLIRAVEPIKGEAIMEQNRQGKSGVELTNGPAKVCQALMIDKQLNGHNLANAPLTLVLNPASEEDVVVTTRIGISKAKDAPLRFYLKDSNYISRK